MIELKVAFSLSFSVLSNFSTINMHDYQKKGKKEREKENTSQATLSNRSARAGSLVPWSPAPGRPTPLEDSIKGSSLTENLVLTSHLPSTLQRRQGRLSRSDNERVLGCGADVEDRQGPNQIYAGQGRAGVRTLGLEANQVQPWLCLISAPCPEADSVCPLHLLLHLLLHL